MIIFMGYILSLMQISQKQRLAPRPPHPNANSALLDGNPKRGCVFNLGVFAKRGISTRADVAKDPSARFRREPGDARHLHRQNPPRDNDHAQ
jgi:hypothetical protein